jgi:hypothetical protein
MEISQEGWLLVLGYQRRLSVVSQRCLRPVQDVQIRFSSWVVLWLGAGSSCLASFRNSGTTV